MSKNERKASQGKQPTAWRAGETELISLEMVHDDQVSPMHGPMGADYGELGIFPFIPLLN